MYTVTPDNTSNTTGATGGTEQFEDTKGIIRNRKSKKNERRTNNDLQNITQKTKARATRTPLKAGDELGCKRMV